MRRPVILLAFLTVTLVSGLFPEGAGAAGFDCARAATPDERAVCADPRLSALDSHLARAYAEAKEAAVYDDVKEIGRDFLEDRRGCKADSACILSAYVSVLGDLRARGASQGPPADITALTIAGGPARRSAKLPARLGQCVATTVDSVHPRLGEPGVPSTDEDFNAGTGIEFGNGGYQVSYEREEALIASSPGDPVVMCLISLPHRCPPGDDRGRVYMTTNTRTGKTWALPDSQHMCGGA